MDHADAAAVVTDVNHEPKLLKDEACTLREAMGFCGQAGEDAIDDGFTVEDHAKPAKGGDGADAVGFDVGDAGFAGRIDGGVFLGASFDAFIGASGRVDHAEVLIAFEGEGPT